MTQDDTTHQPDTNIGQEHKDYLEIIQQRPDSLCLFSCFIDGEPGVALCCVDFTPDRMVNVRPMFVSIPAGTVLTDHDGNSSTILDGG